MSTGPSTKSRPTRPSDSYRAALARCVGLGGILLPLFAALDVFAKFTLYPHANLGAVLTYRAVATLGALLAWWIGRSQRFSDVAARVAHAACLATVAAALAGMAHEFGGPSSVYMQGLSVVAMIRFAIVPARMLDAMAHGLLIAVVYLLGFGLLYLVTPDQHKTWLDNAELSRFAIQYLMVCATIACGSLASHANWTTQHQLYQARKLGRYRLEVPIGRGGQNEVWLAWDGSLKRKVALKILRSTHATEGALALFEREAALASRLQSPHTVRVYDFGASDDGIYYLAMEYLVGADLSAILKEQGPLPPARAVHFALQACLSLEEAHQAGLVHRDVKPSNLYAAQLGTRHDVLKLLDFGVARSLQEADSQLTRTGVLRGTPAYIAPECCRGETATAAADLYGLGATLYHLLTGQPPFRGNPEQVLAQHVHAQPAPPSSHGAQVIPADLEAVVMRCLQKHPAQRFQSARELRQALLACSSVERWSDEEARMSWVTEQAAIRAKYDADTLV